MNLEKPKHKLPSLLFGDRIAMVDRVPDDISRRVESALPVNVSYEALEPESQIIHRSRVVHINDLELMCAASTPVQVKVTQIDQPLLIVPLHGRFEVTFAGQSYQGEARRSACLLPASAWINSTETVSILVIKIDPMHIERVTQTMLAVAGDQTQGFDWSVVHQLDLKDSGLDFDSMIRHAGLLIDGLIQQPELLKHSGIDNMMYRIVAMMLQPERFVPADVVTKQASHVNYAPLLMACDYIHNNLDKCIELNDLAQASGMSARSLQYLFQKQFGCSPMRWLTQQRLERAREQLVYADSRTKITSVASALRFSNLGNFSKLYQSHFRELPSETLARSKKIS